MNEHNNSNWQKIDIQVEKDQRGFLGILEFEKILPFVPKRLFFVKNAAGTRGGHAHKTTEEFIVMVSGHMTVFLDNGITHEEFKLTDSESGLYVPKKVWIDQHSFSSNCSYVVLASTKFEENDYIRDRKHFEGVR